MTLYPDITEEFYQLGDFFFGLLGRFSNHQDIPLQIQTLKTWKQ